MWSNGLQIKLLIDIEQKRLQLIMYTLISFELLKELVNGPATYESHIHGKRQV